MARRARDDRDEQQRTGRRTRSKRIGLRRLVGWAAFLPIASRAPMYGRLIFELVRDERTPLGRKAMLAGALGYLVLGRDIVPDDVPLVGGLDDLVVVVLAVELFLDGIPGDVLDEKLDQLGIGRREFDADVARIRRLTPRPVRSIIYRAPGAIAVAGDALAHTGIGPRVRAWIKEGTTA